MEMFETLFENLRAEPVSLYLPDGAVLKTVLPGGKISIGVVDPKFLYARWERVRFFPYRDGAWLEFTKRPGFVEPDLGSPWVTWFLNSCGDDLEEIWVDGGIYYLPLGIPVRIAIRDLFDPFVEAESVELSVEIKREKREGSDYFTQKSLKFWRAVRQRNDNDLRKIRELRKPR